MIFSLPTPIDFRVEIIDFDSISSPVAVWNETSIPNEVSPIAMWAEAPGDSSESRIFNTGTGAVEFRLLANP
jgi:hypothetical protein